MPHYFFHLVDSGGALLDPDGVELAYEDVVHSALVQARDCIAGDVKSGKLDLHYCIEVHDADGELVHSLKFADALEIVPVR